MTEFSGNKLPESIISAIPITPQERKLLNLMDDFTDVNNTAQLPDSILKNKDMHVANILRIIRKIGIEKDRK